MNRREAIAALVAMPEVARIARAELKPDDVIVIECDLWLAETARQQIEAQVLRVWPGRRVLVLDKGLHLQLASSS